MFKSKLMYHLSIFADLLTKSCFADPILLVFKLTRKHTTMEEQSNRSLLLKYFSFIYRVTMPPGIEDLSLSAKYAQDALSSSFKEMLHEITGCTLKDDEDPVFSIAGLTLEETETITLGEIYKQKNLQFFVRCLDANGKEFCPILRDLKIYRERCANLNAEMLIMREGT